MLMIRLDITRVTHLFMTWNLLEYIWLVSRIIKLNSDIETNPGPKYLFSSQGFKIFH